MLELLDVSIILRKGDRAKQKMVVMNPLLKYRKLRDYLSSRYNHQYGLYLETRHIGSSGGFEHGTFRSRGACSAIWATVLGQIMFNIDLFFLQGLTLKSICSKAGYYASIKTCVSRPIQSFPGLFWYSGAHLKENVLFILYIWLHDQSK